MSNDESFATRNVCRRRRRRFFIIVSIRDHRSEGDLSTDSVICCEFVCMARQSAICQAQLPAVWTFIVRIHWGLTALIFLISRFLAAVTSLFGEQINKESSNIFNCIFKLTEWLGYILPAEYGHIQNNTDIYRLYCI